MTKIELEIIALEGKKNELEKELGNVNTQIADLRKVFLYKKYGLKTK